jgi:hypothetical protein
MTLDYVLLRDRNLALASRQGPEINSRAVFGCHQDLTQEPFKTKDKYITVHKVRKKYFKGASCIKIVLMCIHIMCVHFKHLLLPYKWQTSPIPVAVRSKAARLLRSWVRIPPGTWTFVCCECHV